MQPVQRNRREGEGQRVAVEREMTVFGIERATRCVDEGGDRSECR